MHAPFQLKTRSSQVDTPAKKWDTSRRLVEGSHETFHQDIAGWPTLNDNRKNEPVRLSYNFNSVSPHAQTPFFVQPKLSVNTPGDEYEQEADAVADKIMHMSDSALLKQPLESFKTRIQRKCAKCEKDDEETKVQRKESNNSSQSFAPFIVQEVLNSSSGKQMDNSTRSFMESRFNHDFSSVKIYDNNAAAESTCSINALAFTTGNHIVFNTNQYNPRSNEGKKLLAHELTHVIQQHSLKPGIQKKDDTASSAPGANEVLPFKVGARLLVTNLISANVLNLAVKFSGDSAGILEILRDPEISANLTATVTTASPDHVEAVMSIPAIPAKGNKKPGAAMKVNLGLQRQKDGTFNVQILWAGANGGNFSLSPVNARKNPDGSIELSMGKDDPRISISNENTKGQRIVSLTNLPTIAKMLVSDPLQVVSLSEIKAEKGSLAEKKEIKEKTRDAKDLVSEKNNQLTYGTGLQLGSQVDPMFYLGWRLTLKPLANIIQVPVQVQLDYIPQSGFLVGASAGIQTVLPTKVPLTLTITGGGKGGFLPGPVPEGGGRNDRPPLTAFGPTFEVGASLPLGKRVTINLDTQRFWNLVKGGSGIQSITLGGSVSF